MEVGEAREEVAAKIPGRFGKLLREQHAAV
jgi:hypothetical protein